MRSIPKRLRLIIVFIIDIVFFVFIIIDIVFFIEDFVVIAGHFFFFVFLVFVFEIVFKVIVVIEVYKAARKALFLIFHCGDRAESEPPDE